MFRVIEARPETALQVMEGSASVQPPSPGTFCWIDLLCPDEADLALLGTRFAFHPLALEDCAHANQRSKAEEYGEYTFIVSHGLDRPDMETTELRRYELHAFLGTNYLVTVHDGAIPGLDSVWTRVSSDAALMRRGVDFVYYLVSDRIVDDNLPLIDQIGEELETIEEGVLTSNENTTLEQIFALKRLLAQVRKVMFPQRDVFANLARRSDDRVSERTAVYFRDVHDHLARIGESIDASRDLLGNALDAYLSAQSLRTSEIMKALAIVSAVFMPLTFITGFFGQNFEHLPYGSDPLMYSMIASCILVPIGLLAWFKSRNWF